MLHDSVIEHPSITFVPWKLIQPPLECVGFPQILICRRNRLNGLTLAQIQATAQIYNEAWEMLAGPHSTMPRSFRTRMQPNPAVPKPFCSRPRSFMTRFFGGMGNFAPVGGGWI